MTVSIVGVGIQIISTTLWWIGIYIVLRTLDVKVSSKRFIAIIAGVLLWGWFLLASMLGSQGFFNVTGSTFPKIPLTVLVTLIIGFAFLFSATFKKMLRAFPMHWLIGIQVFRVLGVVFLLRYAQGTLPGVFAIPAGIGNFITGITAPFVAYWYYKQKPWSRGIAIIWNIFGIADLVNALAIGILSSPALRVIVAEPPVQLIFPLLLIPTVAVPRYILLHAYTLWLLRKKKTTSFIATGFKPPTS